MTRHIGFDRLHNFRDLGGYRGAGGREVRWGRLYRSDSLGKLSQAGTPRTADAERFAALGIRTVIDLRYPWEVRAQGRVPEYGGLAYCNLSIEHRPYDQAAIDPAVDPWRFLADRFGEVAADGVTELREVLEVIAADSGPLVFHCASGKDRTGLVAAVVLALLGVGDDEITADFALTELATGRLIEDWRAAHPGRDLRWPGYGRAPAEVMRLFLADLAAGHGSAEGYARSQLGVGDELIAELRGRLLAA